LEAYLARFKDYTTYLNWDERDQFYNLSVNLHDAAAQILWDTNRPCTFKGMVQLFRNRFGSAGQAERFRAELAELCVRRRKPGETLQKLYQDVLRLVSLAYPGPTGELGKIVGRDSFLDALDNHAFRIRILEKDPTDMDTALQIAVKLEAYDSGRTEQSHAGVDRVQKPKEQFNRVVTEGKPHSTASGSVRSDLDSEGAFKDFGDSMRNCISQMSAFQSAVANQTNRLQQGGNAKTKQGGNKRISFGSPQGTQGATTSGQAQVMTVGNAVQPQPPLQQKSPNSNQSSHGLTPNPKGKGRGACYNCNEFGHFKRDCPHPEKQQNAYNQSQSNGNGQPPDPPQPPRVQVIDGNNSKKSTYLTIHWNGKQYNALLDTRCEVSVISHRLIPKGTVLTSPEADLFAANMTKISLLGRTDMDFVLDGKTYSITLAVTDAIDELILGIDFLTKYAATWEIASGKLHLDGKCFLLQPRVTANRVRRLYSVEPVCIPARSQTDVPVRITWPTMHPTKTDWLVESKPISENLVVGRTLVSGNASTAVVLLINMSNHECQLDAEAALGMATQASAVLETDNATGLVVTQTLPLTAAKMRTISTQVDTSHVDCVMSQLGDNLTEQQKVTVDSFVRRNADVFSASEFDLGKTNLLQHSIELTSTKPVRQALRRHPAAYLPQIDQYVSEMVDHGIVQPMPGSEWVANIVLVREKDGNLRYCVDYRGLNTITQKQNYLLPRIDTCLESLGNNCLFTSLDMRSGYWQVPVKPEDREKTCFVTRKGVFGFNVLPFGLCNAPATFQRYDLVSMTSCEQLTDMGTM